MQSRQDRPKCNSAFRLRPRWLMCSEISVLRFPRPNDSPNIPLLQSTGPTPASTPRFAMAMRSRFCRQWPVDEAGPVSPFLSQSPVDLPALISAVSAPDRGGIATFLGMVRNHQDGQAVLRLEYSAYEPMAEAESARIVAEAEARWPVKVALSHRLGDLTIGDVAVAVVAAGAHRAPAFEACRYVIEEVKRRVPVWKKEFYADGTVKWVDPTSGATSTEKVPAR